MAAIQGYATSFYKQRLDPHEVCLFLACSVVRDDHELDHGSGSFVAFGARQGVGILGWYSTKCHRGGEVL